MKQHPLGIQPWGNSLLAPSADVRNVGLGSLACLSDEILLDLFAQLPAAALGRLACCSKALYCFASHEDFWKAYILNEDELHFSWQGSWQQTFATARGAPPVKKQQRRSKVRADGLFSDLLYQPWFCATAEILPEWLELDNIDRRPKLTPEQFRKDYELPNRPVLIPGAAGKWPALRKWNNKYLKKAFAGKNVIVGNMPMSFQEYLRYAAGNTDDMPLYLFDKEFIATAPHLANDYWVPEVFSEDLFSVLGDKRPDYRWLIMGPPRSGSSFHIDPNATSAWNAVVTGSKKWILFPPSTPPPGVHPSADGADVATPVSLVEWFLNFYSEAREGPTNHVECIARAGDVVFVPSGWWHLVLNLEESIAITQNYVSAANLPKVLKFLQPGKGALVSGCSHTDRKLLYQRFVEALQEQQPAVWAQHQEQERARQEEQAAAARLSSLFKQPAAARCASSAGGAEPAAAGAGAAAGPAAAGGFSFNFSFGGAS